MKICLVGEGAQGMTYMDALQKIGDIEVVSLAAGIEADGARFAEKWAIPHYSLELSECLRQPGVEAVIDTSPSHLHARHAEQILNAGKHLLLEIPMALNLADSERLVELEEQTGLTCMVAHTRRFTPTYMEIHRRIRDGELLPYHIVFQTYFFRRENLNRFGQPRTWVDSLLWHHACHQIDAVYWFLGDPEMQAWGQAGADHPQLGIPMDISLTLRDRNDCIVTGALSFNNHGPIDVQMRVIGEQTTLNLLSTQACLLDHDGSEIIRNEPGEPFIAQCREFFTAIDAGRKPATSFGECVHSMRLLDRIQQAIDA